MAITYLKRTAAEIEADRRDDMERDAWGRENYAAYRAEWDAHLQRMANQRAVRNAELSKRLAEIYTLMGAASKLTACIRSADLMRQQDYRIINADDSGLPF